MNISAVHIATGVGAVVSALVVVLGLIFDWETWVWLPLAAVLGPTTMIVLRSMLLDRDTAPTLPAQHSPTPAPPAPPQPVAKRATISQLPLPTREKDYRFLFSATVSWLHDPQVPAMGADLGALAKQNVIARAIERTRQYGPDEYALATVELNAVLSERITLANGHYVWASEVTLTLSDADAKRLERISELRKQQALWEHERAHEIGVRDYLGNEVLRDPGSAVTWWFARNLDKPDAITITVREIDNLRRLTRAAHETGEPAPATPLTLLSPEPPTRVEFNGGVDPARRLATAVDQLCKNTEPEVRTTLYRRLADLLRVHGFAEAAEALRSPGDTTESEEASTEHGTDEPGSAPVPS